MSPIALRRCPLWQQTINELNSLILNRGQFEPVFLNRCKQPLTRFGIHTMVKRYVKKIIKQLPSKALACCEVVEDIEPTHWRDNKGLMDFLDAI